MLPFVEVFMTYCLPYCLDLQRFSIICLSNFINFILAPDKQPTRSVCSSVCRLDGWMDGRWCRGRTSVMWLVIWNFSHDAYYVIHRLTGQRRSQFAIAFPISIPIVLSIIFIIIIIGFMIMAFMDFLYESAAVPIVSEIVRHFFVSAVYVIYSLSSFGGSFDNFWP